MRGRKIMCLYTMLIVYDGPQDIILVHLVVFLFFYRHGIEGGVLIVRGKRVRVLSNQIESCTDP